jgi:hypothetical protein
MSSFLGKSGRVELLAPRGFKLGCYSSATSESYERAPDIKGREEHHQARTIVSFASDK